VSADLGELFASAMAGGVAGPLSKASASGSLALLDRDEDEDDLEKVTELEWFQPSRVDGVNGPANGAPTLLLKALGRNRPAAPLTTRVVKTEGEKRVSIHLAYPALKRDVQRAADGFVDFAGPDAVQDAAWHFMKQGAKIGLFHEDGTTGAGTCVESWLHRSDPWVIKAVDGSTQTIMPGDWLIAIQWPPDTWELVKSGVINGVSMQGLASRRKPSPEALAGLRKGKAAKRLAKAQAAAADARLEQLRNAAAAVWVEASAQVYGRVAELAGRIGWLEKRRAGVPVDEIEERHTTGSTVLVKGAGGRTVGVAKSVKQARAWAADWDAVQAGTAPARVRERVLERARDAGEQEVAKASGNPKCGKCGRFAKTAGANFCSKCGTAFASKAGGMLANAEERLAPRKCRNCKTKFHPERPACPHCGLIFDTGNAAKSLAKSGGGISEAELAHVAVVVRKATSDPDPDRRLEGIGELVARLGPDAAAKVIGGEPLSPGEFTRAYLSAGRAPLNGLAGAPPRIPDMTHVIHPDDFRRPALQAGHQRQNPLSPLESLQQAGQLGVYGPGLGVPANDRYATSPTSTTLAPALAQARSMFANAPVPGDARGR
jgi:hypothetical protein